MHIENIDYMIGIMQQAQNLDMINWQEGPGWNGVCKSIEELHRCGNSACFAGYMALSPKFMKEGGYPDPDIGMPILGSAGGSVGGSQAVAKWLDIPMGLATSIVMGDSGWSGGVRYRAWPKDLLFSQIRPDNVITMLIQLKEKGPKFFDINNA